MSLETRLQTLLKRVDLSPLLKEIFCGLAITFWAMTGLYLSAYLIFKYLTLVQHQ